MNYCNLLLSDAPKYQLKRLQKIQNAAAGFVLKRHANVQDVIDLKWLPVEESIDTALAKTAHNAIHNVNWPTYLRLTRAHVKNRNLRSAEDNKFNIDATGSLNGCFADLAAKCFNDLPVNIKKIESKPCFNVKCFNYYFDKATARILNLS